MTTALASINRTEKGMGTESVFECIASALG
jgi:hypothetical protein